MDPSPEGLNRIPRLEVSEMLGFRLLWVSRHGYFTESVMDRVSSG